MCNAIRMKNYFSISAFGEKINSTNLVLFKFFQGKLRLQFWQPCQEASNKSQNASPQCPKIWKIRREKFSPIHRSSEHVDFSFDKPTILFQLKVEKISLNVQRWSGKEEIQKNDCFHKFCLMICGMQSLQTLRQVSTNILEVFLSRSAVGEKRFSKSLVFLKFFLWKPRLQFRQLCQEASNKSRTLSAQNPQITKKYRTQGVLPSSLSSGRLRWRFDYPARTYISERPKISCPISKLQRKKVI